MPGNASSPSAGRMNMSREGHNVLLQVLIDFAGDKIAYDPDVNEDMENV
jgi:hypothetical protein